MFSTTLGEKERSLGLWVPFASSQCLAHFCSRQLESPLSPAPSQGSRCKVLPPGVLCPGTLHPMPNLRINSCRSRDTRGSQGLTRAFPPCSPPEPQRGRCPVLLPGPARFQGPFPVLPQPPLPAPRAPAASAPLPGAGPGGAGAGPTKIQRADHGAWPCK